MKPEAKAEIDRRCRQYGVSDAKRHEIYGDVCQFMEEVEASGKNSSKIISVRGDVGPMQLHLIYEPFDPEPLTEADFIDAMQEAWDAAG